MADEISKVENGQVSSQSKDTIALIDYIVGYIRKFVDDNKQLLSEDVRTIIRSQNYKQILSQKHNISLQYNYIYQFILVCVSCYFSILSLIFGQKIKKQRQQRKNYKYHKTTALNISDLFALLKQLVVSCPDFGDQALFQRIEQVHLGVSQQNNDVKNIEKMADEISKVENGQVSSQSKDTIALIDYIVGYIRKFVEENQQSLSTKTKAVVERQASKDILDRDESEPWGKQKILSLFALLKQLVVSCPDFGDQALFQRIEQVHLGVSQQNNDVKNIEKMADEISKVENGQVSSQSKDTIALIDYIVGYIRKFVDDNKQLLSEDVKAVVESQASKDILDRDESEPWGKQKILSIFALLVQLVVFYPDLQKFIELYIQALSNKSEQKYVLQSNNNLLLLVDEVLHQQNIRREKNQTNILNKYEQYLRLDNPLDYLLLLVQNSPSITHQRDLESIKSHYTNLITENGKFHGLFLFIQELYNLRSIESIFWRNITHYLQNNRNGQTDQILITNQCIYSGTDMSLFNFIKVNKIQQHFYSSGTSLEYQHGRIIGLPYPHVTLCKQLNTNQEIIIALATDEFLQSYCRSLAQINYTDYYNIQCPENSLLKQLYLPLISPQLWLCPNKREQSVQLSFNSLTKLKINNQYSYFINKQSCFNKYFEIKKVKTAIQYHINLEEQVKSTLLTTSSGYINLKYIAVFYYLVQQQFDELIINIDILSIKQLLVQQKLQYLTEINALLLFLYTIVKNENVLSKFKLILQEQKLCSMYFSIVGSFISQRESMDLLKEVCQGSNFILLQQPFDDFIYENTSFSQFQQNIRAYGVNYSKLVFESLKQTKQIKTLICAISIDKQKFFSKFLKIDQKHPDFLVTFHGFEGLEQIMNVQDGVYYVSYDSGNHSYVGLHEKTKNISRSIIQVGPNQSDVLLNFSEIKFNQQLLVKQVEELNQFLNSLNQK
uniref:Uncharacterized protein n=1 Tax=Spironucleus salmonicida TaxID=348837 RepID=V6LHN7_9EUKA|eukprot:EST43201.1 Hypothetical protein SS50377_17142 [Spironucleus salmonicida]